MVGVVPKKSDERLKIELYQLFREYSALDISYNTFVKEIDKFILELGDKNVRTTQSK